MHTALWVLAIISGLGAFVAAARPKHSGEPAPLTPATAEVAAS
jgi:hypothetical protein